MIHIGLDDSTKRDKIAHYVQGHGIAKVVVFHPARFTLPVDGPPSESVEWSQIIQYKFFYRLLQEINPSTLLIINECLRTPNRSDLTYNCLRNYLTRTDHQLVFSRFPCLESPDDFMSLVDLDTRSRWRRSKLTDVSEPIRCDTVDVAPQLEAIRLETDAATRAAYSRQKRELVDGIGAKDPHTIPRQLHLLGGKHKARVATERGGLWVGRNARLKVPEFATYDDAAESRQVLEFCHSYRDWSDYLTASGAQELSCLVSDLKVDSWYFARFQQWSEMQRNALAAIRQHNSY